MLFCIYIVKRACEKFEISCIQRFSLFSILTSSDLIGSSFSLAVLLNELILTAQLLKLCPPQHNRPQNVSVHLSHSPIFSLFPSKWTSGDLFLARSNTLVCLNDTKPLASGLETRTCATKLLSRPPWEYTEKTYKHVRTRMAGFHKPR